MKKKVLVVDDSELMCTIAKDALEKSGFKVITASNGIEANAYLFGQEQADAVVLDVMMPVIQGDRLAKYIRHNKHLNDIPILLISSKPHAVLERMVMETGADTFLQKPFTEDVLVDKVVTMISSRPPRLCI